MELDGLPWRACSDAAICAPDHGAAAFAEDWRDVLRVVRPANRIAASTLSPCFRYSNRTLCMPAFIIGGFPKCGTTTLFGKLSSLPSLAPPTMKEPHWFTRANIGARPVDVYAAYWPDPANISATGRITFEASASTVWDRGARNHRLRRMLLPEALAQLLPDLRLVALVRDPVDRLWSEFKFFRGGIDAATGVSKATPLGFHAAVVEALALWRQCRAVRALAECALDRTLNDHIPRLPVGLFSWHLRRWLQRFPAHHVLVLASEWLAKAPHHAYRAILEFVGAPPATPSQMHVLTHAGNLNVNWRDGDAAPLPETVSLLRAFYAPFEADLRRLAAELKQPHAIRPGQPGGDHAFGE